ncbi:BTAD domain-containing putative transcriptional regulator [Actinoplanes sp. NPDC051494]|uniref:AfsR/SARP family transcriptional regulator n=1 Tax=Actinoplanes sp. NPDC051494 TaxID=3363907 RepID=UPI0037973327
MKYRVLGPMEVDGGSTAGTPRAAKLRVALSTLLLQTNTVVSVQALADELWAQNPPRTAMMTLQVYVSQLRTILETVDPVRGRDSLVTRAPGYLLRIDTGQLDLAVFLELHQRGLAAARAGDDTGAAALQRQALELWRGPLLSDVPHGPILEATAVRMSEMRLAALEHRIRADLRLGRHHALVSELRALTREYPLHEDLHAHLMTALYRSGRQADALRVFTDLRHAMIDELGIEPGAPLREMHRQVLDGDPELLGPGEDTVGTAPGPRAGAVHLPPPVTGVVGRDDAVAEVEAALAEVSAGRAGPACVRVHGRPGVGKTTLALHVAHRAGGAFPGGRVYIDMLAGPGRARTRADVFATFLRRAGVTGRLPADDEELSAAVHHLLNRNRMLLVLDNVTAESQVRPFLPATPGSAVVVTSRMPLKGLGGPRSLHLDVLSPHHAAQLLVATAGADRVADRPEAVREVAALCGHLPIALHVAGARVAGRPHRDLADFADLLRGERSRLDQLRLGDLDVRGTLMLAYEDSPEPVRRAFRRLSLLPAGSFQLWAVAAVLDVDPQEAAEVVDSLVDAQLLAAAGTGRSARFHYPELLSLLAAELLTRHDDAAVAGEATERVRSAYLDLCRHADHLLSPGRSFWAVPAVVGAAAAVVGDDPMRWFAKERRALIHLAQALYRAERWRPAWQLAESLGGYFEAIAAWPDWEVTQRLATGAAARLGDPGLEAVSLISLGDLAWQRRRYAEAEAGYQRAADLADRAGVPQAHSRALIGLADLRLAGGEHAPARAYAEYAMSLSGAADDVWGCCNALRALALGHLGDGRRDQAVRSFMECAVLAGQIRHRRFESFALASAQRIATIEDPGGTEGIEIQPGIWHLPA